MRQWDLVLSFFYVFLTQYLGRCDAVLMCSALLNIHSFVHSFIHGINVGYFYRYYVMTFKFKFKFLSRQEKNNSFNISSHLNKLPIYMIHWDLAISHGRFWRCSTIMREREREMFYLTTHSTHFIYGYMASDIWLRTILIVREETRCRHIGYSFRLAARVLLYAPSHRQDSTYHGLCYTSRGALAGTRNSSMGNER